MSPDKGRSRWRTVAANAALIVASLPVGLAMAERRKRIAGIGYGNSPVEPSHRRAAHGIVTGSPP